MDFNNNELDQGDVETRLWILDCLMEEAANIKRERHIKNHRNSEAMGEHAADLVLLKELFSQKRIDEFQTLLQKLSVGVKECEAGIAQIRELDHLFIQVIEIFRHICEGLRNVPGLEDKIKAFSELLASYINEEEVPAQPGV